MAAQDDILLPHLAFPLRQAADGCLVAIEQDTLEDVRQCVDVMLRTPVGSRPLAPDMGTVDPTFSAGVLGPVLEREIVRQEPRADVEVSVAPVSDGTQHVDVSVDLADGSDPAYPTEAL